MAITYNTSAKNQTSADPPSVNPGASANDAIIAAACTDAQSGTVDSYASGFVQVSLQSTASDSSTMAVAIKGTATGSEGSIAPIDMNTAAIVGVASFSGVDNTTPQDVAATVTNYDGADAGPWVFDGGSITPITNGVMIVAVLNIDKHGTAQNATTTFSTLTGTTGAWTTIIQCDEAGFRSLAIGYALQATAGAVVVRASTTNTDTMGGSLTVMALRPAAGGGPTPILMGASWQ